LYVSAGRIIYALDAKTGKTVWSHNTAPDAPPHEVALNRELELAKWLNTPNSVPNGKGMGLGGGHIFAGLKDGHVIALDDVRGDLIWATQTGLDQPKKGKLAAVAPTFAAGSVFSGLADGDHNLRGRMAALDAANGEIRWQRFAIPEPGQTGHETWPSYNDTWRFGGGGVWTNPAIDLELGLAYFTTGNPTPAYAGDLRPGSNLFTCSVLALDIRTGELRWHFQLVHHDVYEADIGIPVVLYDSIIDGRRRKALAVMRADGYLFQLDRATGAPLLPVVERAVPQLESQRTSATQPFPVLGESVLLSCIDWQNKGVPMGFSLGCMWTPPASPPPSEHQQNVLAPFPSAKGSMMAYNPETKLFYVQATSFLHWPRRSHDPYFLNWVGAVPGLKTFTSLTAINHTGRVAWSQSMPSPSAPGGPLTTAGKLVFQSTGDGDFKAFSATDGKPLWSFYLGNSGGPAATYEIEGQQYVALTAGSNVWAFKLGGAPAPNRPAKLHASKALPDAGTPTREIATTSLHRSLVEPGSRYFIDEFTFDPVKARIASNEKMLFVNNGNMNHEIVSLDGSWKTPRLSPTEEFWVTFEKPGNYPYYCKDHPWSQGEIVVVAESRSRASSSTDSPPTKEGSAQLLNGRQQYVEHCSRCHGDDLLGRTNAPPLAGSTFLERWETRSALDLFDNMRTTMPQTNPGGLASDVYFDITAYLLEENELRHTPGVLDNVVKLKELKISGNHVAR